MQYFQNQIWGLLKNKLQRMKLEIKPHPRIKYQLLVIILSLSIVRVATKKYIVVRPSPRDKSKRGRAASNFHTYTDPNPSKVIGRPLGVQYIRLFLFTWKEKLSHVDCLSHECKTALEYVISQLTYTFARTHNVNRCSNRNIIYSMCWLLVERCSKVSS